MQNDNNDKMEGNACNGAATFIRGALLLQEKWVLMIVHSLMGGSISFNELMRRGTVNTTTLTQRLNLLERTGVLVKTIHSTMPPRTSYELTEAGLALKPILEAITDWSEKYLPALDTSQKCPAADALSCCEATEETASCPSGAAILVPPFVARDFKS